MKCSERLPDMPIIDDKKIIHPIKGGLMPSLRRSGDVLCRLPGGRIEVAECIQEIGAGTNPVWYPSISPYTHWLDAKRPDEGVKS